MKELSEKEAKFVAYKLEGSSPREAAVKAGFSERSAYAYAYELMKRPHIKYALHVTLDDLGINFISAIQPVIDALQATKTVVHGKDSEDGWVDEVPDHPTRLKAASMALDLLGMKRGAYNKIATSPNKDQQIAPGLAEAMQSSDEVELQRIVFTKSIKD